MSDNREFRKKLKEVFKEFRDSGEVPVKGIYTANFNGKEYTNKSYGTLDVFIEWLSKED